MRTFSDEMKMAWTTLLARYRELIWTGELGTWPQYYGKGDHCLLCLAAERRCRLCVLGPNDAGCLHDAHHGTYVCLQELLGLADDAGDTTASAEIIDAAKARLGHLEAVGRRYGLNE